MQQSLLEIPLNQISVSSNYRKTFRDRTISELAASIKENGVLEPIIVRPAKKGYAIVAGERRYRASLQAGLVTIPAVVREVEDCDVLKLQIIENVQREGVPFMEEAYAVKKLRDELSLDVDEIAKMIGKSQSYVYYMLQLTNMSDEARAIAEKGWISKGVAWEIAKLPNTDQQTEAANAMARTQSTKLVTASGAKHFIRNNFRDLPTSDKMRKARVSEYGQSDYASNWKYYLIRFTPEQFKHWQTVVHGRTETAILSEAVDIVMRSEAVKEVAA